MQTVLPLRRRPFAFGSARRTSRELRGAASRLGVALLVVLVTVAMLALGSYVFCAAMLAEREATIVHGQRLQALAAADSGVALALALAAMTPDELADAGGVFDNAGRFRGVELSESGEPNERWRATLIAPAYSVAGERSLRYGLEDESNRLNLNVLFNRNSDADAGRLALMNLPGMTEDIADAIVDWMDADDEPRAQGAESDHYSGLQPSYAAKNGPLASIDELLMVRGVTPGLLYGADIDRNGVIDPQERNRATQLGVDNADGAMDFGWAAYLTVYSAEANVYAGAAKIDLNGDDLKALSDSLSDVLPTDVTTFILVYRQSGPYIGATAGQRAQVTVDLTKAAQFKIGSIVDLIDARSQFSGTQGGAGIVLQSPFASGQVSAALGLLQDTATVLPTQLVPGRINVNEAPRVVLLGVSGMTPETADAILQARQAAPADATTRRHATWLVEEGAVDLNAMKQLFPYVNAGGDVFRCNAIGFTSEPGPAARIEAIVDATQTTPRLLSWKDMSHLGVGYTRAVLGGGSAAR